MPPSSHFWWRTAEGRFSFFLRGKSANESKIHGVLSPSGTSLLVTFSKFLWGSQESQWASCDHPPGALEQPGGYSLECPCPSSRLWKGYKRDLLCLSRWDTGTSPEGRQDSPGWFQYQRWPRPTHILGPRNGTYWKMYHYGPQLVTLVFTTYLRSSLEQHRVPVLREAWMIIL